MGFLDKLGDAANMVAGELEKAVESTGAAKEIDQAAESSGIGEALGGAVKAVEDAFTPKKND